MSIRATLTGNKVDLAMSSDEPTNNIFPFRDMTFPLGANAEADASVKVNQGCNISSQDGSRVETRLGPTGPRANGSAP